MVAEVTAIPSRRTPTPSSGPRSAPCRQLDEPARANTYRRLHDIPADWGTAVNVQAMVFGNMGDDCATGVCFTRDPSTGENIFYGEYLINAQGEDVVAGIRTPQPDVRRPAPSPASAAWSGAMPAAYAELCAVRATCWSALPRHAGHRVHGAAEQGSTCCRTRNGKRTAAVSLKIRRRHGPRG
jgi:pyruvate,orthophosphate dikinase